MADRLELLIEWSSDLLCVEVEGRLVAATADCFVREIEAEMDDRDRTLRAVILNCEKLEHVSGIGWRSVLLLGRTLVERDACLLLTSLSPSLHIIFGDANYRSLLSIHETMTEAFESLSQR